MISNIQKCVYNKPDQVQECEPMTELVTQTTNQLLLESGNRLIVYTQSDFATQVDLT